MSVHVFRSIPKIVCIGEEYHANSDTVFQIKSELSQLCYYHSDTFNLSAAFRSSSLVKPIIVRKSLSSSPKPRS